MDVYLIRHAAAVEETLALPDIARQLSSEGRDQARALGERLRWHDCTPSAVWTSPLVRAVQTTELIVAGLRYTGDVVAWQALAPGGDARALEAELGKLAPTASVVMIGHEPGLSGLGGVLIGRPDFGVLHKCEAVRISDRAIRWRFAHDDEAPRSASKS